MSFSPVQRIKVSEQIAETIREAILTGSYAPGDNLPPERKLAAEFDVNRSSIREAIHRLEAWGLVEVRHGGGTRVVDILASAGLHLLPFLLAPAGRLDPSLLRDLLELRVELLAWTAERAAANGSDEAAASLSATLEALDAATDHEGVQEFDFVFFEQLVQLSRNRVLRLLANGIRRVYMENRQLFLALYATQEIDTSPHRATVEAVCRRDSAAARAAMTTYGRKALESGLLS